MASLEYPLVKTGDIPFIPCTMPFMRHLQYWGIYVNDFCGLVQDNYWTRCWVKRVLLRFLDRVIRPLALNNTKFWQEPASLKKMKQGNATWTTYKVILGWLIDTTNITLELPSHLADRFLKILNPIGPEQNIIATKDWYKVLGEQRFMLIALLGLVGISLLLQEAFCREDQTRLQLNLSKALHNFLEDFR